MPYIGREEHADFVGAVDSLMARYAFDAPRLAYLIARAAAEAVEEGPGGYTSLATIDGVLGTAQMEFRDRVVRPYEKKKRKENGGIY